MVWFLKYPCFFFCFVFVPKSSSEDVLLILERERREEGGGGREEGREKKTDGQTDRCERETSVDCLLYTSQPGIEPAT